MTPMRPYVGAAGLLVSLACSSSRPSAPDPTSMDPSSAFVGESVRVVIRGSFSTPASVDFASGKIAARGEFVAKLGETVLDEVEYVSSTELSARVPGTLPVGPYDLWIEDPEGRHGSLSGAFAVRLPVSPPRDGGDPGDADGGAGDGDEGAAGDTDAGDRDGDSDGGDGTPACTATRTCDDAVCNMDCPTGGCCIVCDGSDTCSGTCSGGCASDCSGLATCDFDCGTGCTYACSGNAVCTVRCDGGCTFSACDGNAECLLRCTDPVACTMACGEPVTDCGNGVLACRTACP